MAQIILYKWQPSLALDAPNPRGVCLNRLLTFCRLDFEARIVTPNRIGSGLSKVSELVSGLPILDIENKKTRGILNIFSELEKIKNVKMQKLLQEFFVHPEVYFRSCWGLESFFYLTVFARFSRENNFSLYLERSVQELGGLGVKETMTNIGNLMKLNLAGTSYVGLDEANYLKNFLAALSHLKGILNQNDGKMTATKKISLADLAIFGCAQSLLSPEMEERKLISQHCPELLIWAKEIDNQTTGAWTKPLVDL